MEAAPISTQASTAGSPTRPGRRLPGGLRPLSGLTLFSVGALVVSISLSLLGDVAANENQRDALHTLVLLRDAWEETLQQDDGADRLLSAPSLGTLAECRPGWIERMRDHRWAEPGTLLRHGYFFSASNGYLLAWPASYGRSGSSAYAVEIRSGGRWVHPGSEQWSGQRGCPLVPGEPLEPRLRNQGEGWRAIAQ